MQNADARRSKAGGLDHIAPADAQIFLAIASSHTLSEAAVSLGLPLHTVSRGLKRLEHAAREDLVRRSREGHSLTDTGRRLRAACHKILEAQHAAEEAIRGKRGELEGTLRLSAPAQFARSVLPAIVPRFQRRHPKLRVEIELYCSNWNQEPKTAHDVFLKVRTPRDSRRHLHVFPSIRQGLFCSENFLTSCHAKPKHPTDLTSLTCLGDEGSVIEGWSFSRESEQTRVHPDFVISVSDPDVLADLTLADAGIAILPLWLAANERTGRRLVRLLPEWEIEPIVFCSLFNGRLRPGSKEHAFHKELTSVLGTADDPRCAGIDPERFFVL